MRYYIAGRSSDLSVIGRESQLEVDSDSRNVSTLDALDEVFTANWAAGTVIARSDHLEPIRARVAHGAILTSFAYINRQLMCCDFAVTDEVQDALRSMSLRPSIFHPIDVDQLQDRCSLLHVPSLSNDSIVFSGSRFFTGSPLRQHKTYHDLNSNEEYLVLKRRPGCALLQPEYIEVRSELMGADILRFRFANTFFSERLVEVALKAGFSGLNFIPASLDAHPYRLYFFNTGPFPRGSGATY